MKCTEKHRCIAPKMAAFKSLSALKFLYICNGKEEHWNILFSLSNIDLFCNLYYLDAVVSICCVSRNRDVSDTDSLVAKKILN